MASLISYGSFEVFYDEVVGFGSYGKVYRAKCGQLPCAAKLLHDTLFDFGDPNENALINKFKKECEVLNTIKHPNIVQHLGTEIDDPSGRPVLLMELMDDCLTKFLERSVGPLPYHIQLNICHDVALALSYLHSNAIIHRDLSSNNVLLIGEGIKAKVTDFGMSKLTDMNPQMTPLTQTPGTADYMPPEAITKPPQYSNKLDCFSHGVLTIQMVTRRCPNPGDANKYIEDPRFPSGRALVQFPEMERRKEDIDLIEPDHPLLPIAIHCLKDRDTERPTADEVCERLATLKKERRYLQSAEMMGKKGKEKDINRAESQKLEAADGVYELELTRYKDDIESKEGIIQQILERLDQLQEENYQMNEELKKLRNQEESSFEHLSSADNIDGVEKKQAQRKKSSSVSTESTWNTGKPAPQPMSSSFGAAAVNGNVAYFSQGNNVYSYTYLDNRWETLQQCRYQDFSLAVVRDTLTTIGGHTEMHYEATNCLLSFLKISYNKKSWKEHYPHMPTKRILPASVTTPTHLVVAGGKTKRYDYDGLPTVEIFNTSTSQWFKASSLPKNVSSPQMTFCDGFLYLSSITTMFSCTLDDLSKTGRHSLAADNKSDLDSVWSRLANIPAVHKTSLVTVTGNVLAIGNAIHTYDKPTNSWSETGQVLTARSSVLTAVLPNMEVVVVGGYLHRNQSCDTTEIGPVM